MCLHVCVHGRTVFVEAFVEFNVVGERVESPPKSPIDFVKRFVGRWIDSRQWELIKIALRGMGCRQEEHGVKRFSRVPVKRHKIIYVCGGDRWRLYLDELTGIGRPDALYVYSVKPLGGEQGGE